MDELDTITDLTGYLTKKEALVRSRLMNLLFVNYGTWDNNSGLQIQALARALEPLGYDCRVAVPKVEKENPATAPAAAPVHYREALEHGGGFADGGRAGLIHAWTPREIVRGFCETYREQFSGSRLAVHLEDNEELLLERYLGKPLVFVLNGATQRARITAEAAIALSQAGTVAPVTIHHRTEFAASMIDGRTVMEIACNPRSAEEIEELWVYLADRLDRCTPRNESPLSADRIGGNRAFEYLSRATSEGF